MAVAIIETHIRGARQHAIDQTPSRRVAKYARGVVVFSQGDPATEVFYLQHGSVKL